MDSTEGQRRIPGRRNRRLHLCMTAVRLKIKITGNYIGEYHPVRKLTDSFNSSLTMQVPQMFKLQGETLSDRDSPCMYACARARHATPIHVCICRLCIYLLLYIFHHHRHHYHRQGSHFSSAQFVGLLAGLRKNYQIFHQNSKVSWHMGHTRSHQPRIKHRPGYLMMTEV